MVGQSMGQGSVITVLLNADACDFKTGALKGFLIGILFYILVAILIDIPVFKHVFVFSVITATRNHLCCHFTYEAASPGTDTHPTQQGHYPAVS